jgi:FAD/FMN-containing dehydrogenase
VRSRTRCGPDVGLGTLEAALRARFGDMVVNGVPATYLADATEARGLFGGADAVVCPTTAQDAAALVAWCYEREVPIVPRGGGTG